MSTMIDVRALVKTYDGPEPVRAVDGMSFQARAGEVFGLLGPNGAGKTTTLRMLSTLLRPDSGSAQICGHDILDQPAAVRASIGYLSTTTGLYGRLTAREMLRYFAELQGVADPAARVVDLMDRFGIHEFANTRCDKLSTGMKQKVNIARALVHSPPVIIFDEPTAGLDVLVAQTFLEVIEEARDAGQCVLFSTHIMREAERLCDRIAVMNHGRILAEGTLEELLEKTGTRHLEDAFIQLVEASR
jgi:sodium transport system ATP-binding protein